MAASSRRKTRVWVSIISAAIVLCAACSNNPTDNSDSSAATSQTVSTPDTVATTSTSPTTTTTTPTTSEATTSTILKPDLEIPTSWESTEAEILGRYMLYNEAYQIAVGPPQIDPNYPPLADLMTERMRMEVSTNIAALDQSKIFVLPDDWRDHHNLRLAEPDALAAEEGAIVEAQDCWIYEYDYVTADGASSEQFSGVDLLNIWMVYQNGEWRIDALLSADERSSGYEQCISQDNS